MNAYAAINFLHQDKSLLIGLAPDPNDQLFCHQDLDSIFRCFHINTLFELVEEHKCPLIDMPLDPSVVESVRKNNGIEAKRIRKLPLNLVHKPGLLGRFEEDDTNLILDGSHRMIWRWEHGYTTMAFYAIPESVWRLCLLDISPPLARSFAERMLR